MKKNLLLLSAMLLFNSIYSQSQLTVFQDWSRNTGTQNLFYKNVTVTDASSNVYVAGATMSGTGNYDIMLVKYNSTGVQQWVKQVDGTAHAQDFATALALDASGNIYVTGAITNDTTTLYSDLFITKYNSSGVQQWSQTYDGTSRYDCGTSIYISGTNVLVVGSSYNATPNLDFVTILYTTAGLYMWDARYNHSSGMNDVPIAASIRSGGMFAAGAVQTGTTTYSWASVKYNTLGAFQTVTTSSGGTTSIEKVNAMVTDASGNIYLAGMKSTVSNGFDYDIIKLNSSLAIQWEHTYDGPDHLEDVANGIQVSASGDVYVTGYSTSTAGASDYLTLKYNSSGSLIWSKRFNDSLNGNDEARAIELDNSGKIVITGSAQTTMSGLDYYTIKYDTAGTVLWSTYFDGDKHLNDKATNIAIDTVGAIIITGVSETSAGMYEYSTVRYVEKNVITPTDYSGAPVNNTFLYYENKGQLTRPDNNTLVPKVRYYTNNGAQPIFIMNDTLSMVFSHSNIAHSSDTVKRVDLHFDKCNANIKVYPLETKEDYANYFLGHCPNGITLVHGSQKLIVPDLYSNIDLMYCSNPDGFKYYLIVKPGGKPSNITMQYSGANTTSISSNKLTIQTAVGSVTYARPFTYQVDNNNNIVSGSGIYANWVSYSGNNYGFTTNSFDTTKTLIIEVKEDVLSCGAATSYKNIRLSSFYGGTKDDRINCVALDTAGNYVYYGGECYDVTFPLLLAFYTSQSTVTQGVLSKFSTYGARKYATYFGGTGGYTSILGISTNISGEPTIVGNSSSSNMPTPHSGGQYYQARSTGTDGFIARFKVNGAGVWWSAYFGGTGNDILNRVVIKGNDTYVVGTGTQASPYVSKTGAYNSVNTYAGTKGLIAHFNAQDSLVWSTYIGTDIKDIDYSSNLIGIGGTIANADLAYSHAVGTNVDSTYAGGTTDGFIAIINSSDNINFATYVGGTSDDKCNAVKFDKPFGANPPNLYVGGSTSSSPSGLTLYQPSGAYTGLNYHGNTDAFMWKYSGTGVLKYASYYGTGTQALQFDEIAKIAVDKNNNAYFCGESNSDLGTTSYLSGTSAWYTQTYNAYAPFHQSFIFALDQGLNLFWATNFGGYGGEWSTDLAVDGKNNYLYLTGVSMTTQPFPAYFPNTGAGPGWYACENASPAWSDGYFSQFKIVDAVVGINEYSFKPESNLICYPNPFNDEITFSFSLNDSKYYTIEVYNTLGQVVYYKNEKTNTESVSKTIELNVNKGIYYVQIKLSNRILAGKIIKQ